MKAAAIGRILARVQIQIVREIFENQLILLELEPAMNICVKRVVMYGQ